MKTFLATFTSTSDAMACSEWSTLSESVRQERTQAGIKAWHAWMEANKARIEVPGCPIGKTLRVSSSGAASARNNICGYVVVSAESHEAAAAMFANHPHFSIFPGEAVEVMECLPVPGV